MGIKSGKICLAIALLILVDQIPAQGYLQSWSYQKGKAIAKKPPPSTRCREPKTDLDKILLQSGVRCLQ